MAVIFLCLVLFAPGVAAEGMLESTPVSTSADDGYDEQGAVLCNWMLWLSIQVTTAQCGLPRRPIDDAINESILLMEDFIVANASWHPTRADIKAERHEYAQSIRESNIARGLWKTCRNPDLDVFRSASAREVRKAIRELLAVPREPVSEPCL